MRKALIQISMLSTAHQNSVLANWLCVQCSGCFAVCGGSQVCWPEPPGLRVLGEIFHEEYLKKLSEILPGVQV